MQTSQRNADPAELARFSALAARWWDPNSEFRPLHQINPLRLRWIESLAPVTQSRIVDVGCGGGILSEAMAHRGAGVVGIDLAVKPLAVARLHAHEQRADVDYRCCSAEDLAANEPHSFDVVTCMEMLEHVPQPDAVIEACARLVKPGGWVFFSTINRNALSYLFAIIGVEYVLRMLPRGTHQWRRFIRPDELIASAQRSGLQLRDKRGLGYNPVTKQFRLPRFLGVGYLLAFQAPPDEAGRHS